MCIRLHGHLPFLRRDFQWACVKKSKLNATELSLLQFARVPEHKAYRAHASRKIAKTHAFKYN